MDDPEFWRGLLAGALAMLALTMFAAIGIGLWLLAGDGFWKEDE